MSRTLRESDLEPLSNDDLRWLLSEQLEGHRRIREQAQSVIRIIISGVGVAVALIGYKLFPDFELPSRTVSIAGGAVQFNGLLQNIAQNSLHVAILFGTTAVVLLVIAVVKSTNVLTSEGPLPTSRHKRLDNAVTPRFEDGTDGTLGAWILTNDERLVEAEREVEQSYMHTWTAFALGSVALLLAIAVLIGSLSLMGLIHTGLVIIGPIVTLYYFWETIRTFLGTVRNEGVRPALGSAGDVYQDMMLHRGVGPETKVTLLMFYGVYIVYSFNIAWVWVTLFVL